MLAAAASAPTDDQLASLTPEERAEAEALVESIYGVEHPADFIERVWPHHKVPPHLRIICDIFMRAMRERVRICISMPPRHGKSITIERCLIWWLLNNPNDVCAYATYNDTKAREESSNARQLAGDAGLHTTGKESLWKTLTGATMRVAGIESGLTGAGVSGVMVVDDPYKDRKQADSVPWRRDVWNWFGQVAFTRSEGMSIIVVHTRWHEEDLIGQLAREMGWAVINIPAIAENDNDIIGRKKGEALWPARFPLRGHEDNLEDIRRIIGEWAFAALYQGKPQPEGTRVFGEPKWYDPATFKISEGGWMVFLGADPAASEKSKADHSSAIALAIRGDINDLVNREAKLLARLHGQWTVPVFARSLVTFQRQWYGASIAVEAVAGFKAVPQILQEIAPNLRIIEVHPSLSKFQRAQPVAAAWNDERGRFQCPLNTPAPWAPTGFAWIGDYIKKMTGFTGHEGDEDDDADATSHAWNVGIEHPATTVKRGARPDPSRWR